MGKDIESAAAHSCSSSTDSSHPRPPFLISNSNNSSVSNNLRRKDLSTDLKLGLSITSDDASIDVSSSTSSSFSLRGWPPVKPLFRGTLAVADQQQCHGHGHGGNASLFVKVYMEGIPIGRKLNLFAHHGYNELIKSLAHMFSTTILFFCNDDSDVHNKRKQQYHHGHVLTYEDKEGDWMMVGDVPWEMFLTTVKRLKITRADRC